MGNFHEIPLSFRKIVPKKLRTCCFIVPSDDHHKFSFYFKAPVEVLHWRIGATQCPNASFVAHKRWQGLGFRHLLEHFSHFSHFSTSPTFFSQKLVPSGIEIRRCSETPVGVENPLSGQTKQTSGRESTILQPEPPSLSTSRSHVTGVDLRNPQFPTWQVDNHRETGSCMG